MRRFQKVSNVTLLFFILLCVLSYVCFTPPLRQADHAKEQTQVSRYIPSKPRFEITGLNYDLNFMGETSFKLKADRFLIRKKKLGLIRFGLAQEGLFENGEMSFFRKEKQKSFKDGLSNFSLTEIIPTADIKKLTSIVMKPVSIFFYDKDNKVSRIYAKNASFGMQKKEIVLSGNVRMTAGEKQIKTSKLIFFPEKEEIYIPENFSLEMQGVEKIGEPITTDIFLNSIRL